MEILNSQKFSTRTNRGSINYVGCFYCSRAFCSTSERNEHVLTHFEQETCLKCNQNLLRVGEQLYVVHGTFTCIDAKVKEEATVEDQIENSLDYEPVDEHLQTEYDFEDTNINHSKSEIVDDQAWNDGVFGSIEVFAASIPSQNTKEPSLEIVSNNEEQKSMQSPSKDNSKTAIRRRKPKIVKSPESKNESKKTKNTTPHNLYTCDICQKSFRRLDRIRLHMSSHSGERYTCKLCGRTNLSKSSMERSHFKPKFTCSLCNKRFCIKKALKKHSIDVHFGGMDPKKKNPMKYVKRFKCKIEGCNELLSDSNRSGHMASYHDLGPFQCDICGKQTKTRANMKYHILAVHVPSGKKFKCKLCERSFITQSMLSVHNKRSHIKALEYMCSECGAGFVQAGQLRIHMTKHTGEKPHKCSYEGCTKAFRTATRRTEHMRSHTGEKPYLCPLSGCDRRFAYAVDLKRHKFNSHGIYFKKFPCTICSEIFPENMLLKKHMKKHEIQS